MTVMDEVAKTLAERDAAIAERDFALKKQRELEDQIQRQAGGIAEERAQNKQLILRNERLAAQCARYDKHFRDALASSESIIKHRAELEPELPGVPAEPPPTTLKGRLRRLAKNGGDAA